MGTEEPDEIWMTPDMEVWMPAMEKRCNTTSARQRMKEHRQWHEDSVLNFVRTVFNKQSLAGRYAHLLMPKDAHCLNRKPSKKLRAKFLVDIDTCDYIGCRQPHARLTLRTATNKRTACMLHRLCTAPHCKTHAITNPTTPDELAWQIAAVTTRSDIDPVVQEVYPVEEEDDFDREMKIDEGDHEEHDETNPGQEVQDDETVAEKKTS